MTPAERVLVAARAVMDQVDAALAELEQRLDAWAGRLDRQAVSERRRRVAELAGELGSPAKARAAERVEHNVLRDEGWR